MVHQVTVRYSDGAVRAMPVARGQTVLEAAELSAVPIVSSCQSGICGTCVGRCTQGSYELGSSIGLSEVEKSGGRILTCQTLVQSDCVIELDYPLGANAARIVAGDATVVRVEQLSPGAALLVLDVAQLPQPLLFQAGQYAQLRVPGTESWRSYSFTHAPRDDSRVEFLIRLLPAGEMSDYLRERAHPGDRIAIRGSKGSFFPRAVRRPVLLMAGGTGLSAILSVAEQLVRDGVPHPIRLYYGVTHVRDLVLLPRLRALEARHPRFSWSAIVCESSPEWQGPIGHVTDLLASRDLNAGDVDVYLCGPPAMVDATREWLRANRMQQAALYFEKFVASGAKARAAAGNARPVHDASQLARQARGVALVIGGSIAGIAAAKVLTESFRKVVVLEKDVDHRRAEGRPGAAQGWHLHHLLRAGQRELETLFPGIIDDMVAAGAFKVDMGEQYRMLLVGEWKKTARSGVEIVCAGRPLLEWCLRRRLDAERAIEYRYDCEAKELIFDPTSRAIIGVELEHDGRREVVAAEFVVDAAGKNTPVPAALARAGFGSPQVEEDHINCFYSTLEHRVDPARVWRDRVMVICYAYRPNQRYYAAQYFTDSTRSVLSTTLVGYDCYGPPRNAQEFREFARLMPSQVIGDELDGLEPCSPVYNFRYPTMQRYHYDRMRNPPAGLVAVGDSCCSADPVSGAGMSKAMLELRELRALLRAHPVRDSQFVRRYYRAIKGIADLVWSVIREQNLRFPWIVDVKQKRPFYFRAHNWYVDRVFELMHDDADIYRLYLEVTHFIAPPRVLMKPRVVARVLGKWLATRLRGDQTLIERNFGRRASERVEGES